MGSSSTPPPSFARYLAGTGSKASRLSSEFKKLGFSSSALNRSTHLQRRALSKLEEKHGEAWKHLVSHHQAARRPEDMVRHYGHEVESVKQEAAELGQKRMQENIRSLRAERVRQTEKEQGKYSALRAREVTSAISESARGARTSAIRTESAETSAVRKKTAPLAPPKEKPPARINTIVGF